MGKASRDKGKRGEQVVVRMAKERGLSAERTSQLQCGASHLQPDVRIQHGDHMMPYEVKHDNTMSVDKMVKQAQLIYPGILAWKRDRKEWRVDLPLAYFLNILAAWKNA